MKHSLFFLAMCLMCCACSSDENIGGTSAVKNISATLEPMTFDGLTRTSHTVSDTQGFLSEWAEGDILGIYPVGGDQVAFPISAGAGTSTAKFDGGSWALRPAIKYSAYYPFSKDNYMISQTEIPVNYVGQSQNGNASTAHLGSYYYVAAAAAEPTSTGSVNLAMKHMGSLLNLILTMPVAASYTDVVVETEAEGDYFPTTGTIDLTSAAPAITPKTYAHSIHLRLSNVSTASANQTISLLMMMAPANMLEKNLLVTVTDTEGKTYQFKGAGKNYLAAKAYRLTLTEVIGGTGANLTPDGWDDEETNMYNGHEYVDLGLPSGTLWATCNIGATNPLENGTYFSWGETSSKESYSTNNYSYWNPSKNIGTHIAKTQYDAATQNWGGNWQMPTSENFYELLEYCSIMSNYGEGFIELTSKINGNKVIFKLSGRMSGSSLAEENDNAYLWLDNGEYNYAYDTKKVSSAQVMDWGHDADHENFVGFAPCNGLPIRPVFFCNMHNGHEYVDLGLKDEQGRTIYWATCNVGATKPEDYGFHFAWGEISTYEPDHFYMNLYKWYNEPNDTYTKYCLHSILGIVDGKSTLDLEDDAAHANWGGSWRMPTKAEFVELKSNYGMQLTTQNGIPGCLIVGKNGNSIFLPTTGTSYEGELSSTTRYGKYWSSTIYEGNSGSAYYLYFNVDNVNRTNSEAIAERYIGHSIRPVCVLSE